jgi:HEAT repeat protein
MRKTIKASDPWARRQAARCLGALGPAAKDAVPALSALLHDQDDSVRDATAKSLKSIRR